MSVTQKKQKVVVIEGDASFGKRIVDALKSDGYEATLYTDGTSGLASIYDTLPHLILVDIVLPGMDGYQILQKKIAEPLLSKVPVFLLSTQGVPIDMARVPQGSVKEFILDLHADTNEIVKRINMAFGYNVEEPSKGSVALKKKLVWVEDDKLIGTILAKKLVGSGFELFHAKNGTEAFSHLTSQVPDAIILDLLLPGISGLDILQKIKADPRLKNVPVMILSNLNKQSDIDRSKALGAQKFLVKAAASLDQIVAEVRSLCGI